MLWSPNEVLAYLQDDLGFPKTSAKSNPQTGKVGPKEPFGGFQVWPSCKEDFILIAENSEIHGPNPLFTIPELDSSIDLNNLSTQILSADYQGLSNNKILPGSNAQLLMPDLATDVNAAINYFFLFDAEARGFVRPTCIAYFTADKYKLVRLAKSILKKLSEAAEILQHSNIVHHTNNLRDLRDSIRNTTLDSENSASKGIAAETRLKDIQAVLDLAESYKGNELFDEQTIAIMEYLKTNANSEKIRNFDSSFSAAIKTPPDKNLDFRPHTKKSMKNLYLICKSGLVLGLYYLHIMRKYFRRKYENIAVSETVSEAEGSTLYFGACIKTSTCDSANSNLQVNKCFLHSCRVLSKVSLENNIYFEFLNDDFENLLIKFINWERDSHEMLPEAHSKMTSLNELTNSSGFQSNSLCSNGVKEDLKVDNCHEIIFGHIVPLSRIWDILDYIAKENPDLEASFLKVLKLFSDTQRLLFSVFTQVPLVVISTQQELNTAQSFIKALSVFIPRSKSEVLFVDFDRQLPLKREHLSKLAAVNFCLCNQVIEDVIPLELLSSLCILNLKNCSLTGPRYFGRLLSNVDQQIQALSANGPVFPIFVSILLEIEETIKWWHMLTASSADSTTASKYVLSKGYNRMDMQIIEKLSRLCRS